MALDPDYGHGADFICFLVGLDVGDGLDEVAQSDEEALKVLDNLNVSVLLIFLFLLLLFLVMNSLWR